MKKYLTMFRIQAVSRLQYRGAAVSGMITQLFWGMMFILLYHAFIDANPAQAPMSRGQIASYVWLHQAFLSLFMIWGYDSSIFASIRSGDIAYDLVRPVGVYGSWLVKTVASRIAAALLRFFPIVLVTALLPDPMRLDLAVDPLTYAAFLATLVLGMMVTVSTIMLVYISTFYSMDAQGMVYLVSAVYEITSGGIVPLPFFPESIRVVLEWLPFGSAQNIPLRVFVGDITGNELALRMGLQVIWVVVFVVLGRYWLGRALRRVTVQGG